MGIQEVCVVGVIVNRGVDMVKACVAEAVTSVEVDVTGMGVRDGIAEGLVSVEFSFRVSSIRFRKKPAKVLP